MENKNKKIEIFTIKNTLKAIIASIVVFTLAYLLVSIIVFPTIAVQKFITFIKNPVPIYKIAEINCIQEKKYKYNDKIPVEIIKNEIKKQAIEFNNDARFMLELGHCESGFNNLADNSISTAKGVFQFVANTWEVTESNTKKISEFDYIANIREANIKIANHEYHHWVDCIADIKAGEFKSLKF